MGVAQEGMEVQEEAARKEKVSIQVHDRGIYVSALNI